MRRARGFTLIEVMIVVVVIAVLAAIGFPSYREHIARGQRSQGQQWLSEVAQRQEQFMLDRRQYADSLVTMNMTQPAMKYGAPTITLVAGPPPGFVVCMDPSAGSAIATRSDGTLCINNQGQRWRQQTGGNTTFESGSGECAWDDRSCRITGEG